MNKAEKEAILQQLGGIPEDVYNEIGRDFVKIARSQEAQLEEAVAAGDWTAVARVSHSLKGSSGNLRIVKIQELMLEVEHALQAKEPEKVPVLIRRLP